MHYVYCPVCSGLLAQSVVCLICTKCSYEVYDNPRPSVGLILVNDDKKILLLKRAKDPRKGIWDIPGGFIDKGETLEGSVKREIFEELGITLEKYNYIRSYSDTYIYQGVTLPILTAIFYSHVPNTININLDGENSEYTFFSFKEIPFDNFGFSSLSAAVQDFVNSIHKAFDV